MKILITGTHSTGKSTLLNILKKLPELQNYKFIGGVTREIQKRGFKINEEGDWKTQLYCISFDIQNLLENENQNVIYDRSVLDTYVYTSYIYNHDMNVPWQLVTTKSIIRSIFELLKFSFDIIIWLRPEFEIEDDEVRSKNKEFQEWVDKRFNQLVRIDNKYVFQLTGSIEERVKQFKRIYNDKKKGEFSSRTKS